MKGRQRKKVDATFSMSSMTDIVFLLLIFFIVLSTLVSPPGVVIDLPKVDGKPTTGTTSLSIDININEEYSLNGKTIGYDALLIELASRVGDLKDTSIKLGANGKVPLEVALNLFADIKELGYSKVVIATQSKDK
jgi:biopolymer transport protein ExbD